MAGHEQSRGQQVPMERELNIPLVLSQQLADLKQRVAHLETLEAANNFAPLDKVELTADASEITFADISGDFAVLKIIMSVRTDSAATTDTIGIRFNSDSGNNYDSFRAFVRQSAAWTTQENFAATLAIIGPIVGDNAPADVFSMLEFILPDYAGANQKSLSGNGELKRVNTTGDLFLILFAAWWRDTDGIVEIELTPIGGTNFLAGSKFYLFGLKTSAP